MTTNQKSDIFDMKWFTSADSFLCQGKEMAVYSKTAGSLQMLHEIPAEVNSGQHSQKCGDCLLSNSWPLYPTNSILSSLTLDCDELMLNVLRCQLTY